MQIEGKAYRSISFTYFILHCVHFVISLVGSLLPYYGGVDLVAAYETLWIAPCIGLTLLALGCFCAWRTIRGPHYCIGALLVNLCWPVIVALPGVSPYLGAVIASYFEQPCSLDFGIGYRLLASCDFMVFADIAFVIYMLILLFMNPKSTLHK